MHSHNSYVYMPTARSSGFNLNDREFCQAVHFFKVAEGKLVVEVDVFQVLSHPESGLLRVRTDMKERRYLPATAVGKAVVFAPWVDKQVDKQKFCPNPDYFCTLQTPHPRTPIR